MRGRFPKPGVCVLAGLFWLGACAPMVSVPGPEITAPALTAASVRTPDGAMLPLRTWMPKSGEPWAVIVALHGFNDYSNFLALPGRFLSRYGLALYAYDQRGFGAAPNRGLWPGIEAYVNDLKTVVRLVRSRHPSLPLYLLGESMGGAAIMVAMTGEEPPAVDGIILAAPAVWGRTTMPWYQRGALWLAAHTVPWLTVSGRHLNIRPSDNVAMLRALGQDPLVIKETRVDTLHGLVDLMDAALAASARLDAQALILYGKHDEIVPKDPTRMMIERLPESGRLKRRLALYENGHHMLLRDLGAETLWRDIAHWVHDSTARLPSGADARADLPLARE